MATCKSEKWTTVILMLSGGWSKVMRAIVHKEVQESNPDKHGSSPWNLDDLLDSNRLVIYDVTKKGSERILSKAQFSLLFPGRSKSTDIEQWDLQILSLILIYICGPNLKEFRQQFEMDIKILKEIRNKLCHAGEPALSDDDYDYYCTTIKEIIEIYCGYLDDKTFSTTINEYLMQIENGSISLHKSHIILKDWYDKDKRTETILEEVKDELVNVNNSMRELTEVQLMMLKTVQSLVKDRNCIIPDTDVEIIVKNCNIDKEKFITEKFLEILIPLLHKETDLNDETDYCVKTAVAKAMTQLLSNERKLTGVRQKCVLMKIRCPTFLSIYGLWRDCIDGTLTSIFKPVKECLSQLDGCSNIDIEVVVTENEFLRCMDIIVNSLLMGIERQTEEHLQETTADDQAMHTDICQASIIGPPLQTEHGTAIRMRIKPRSIDQLLHMWQVCHNGGINKDLQKAADAMMKAFELENLHITARLDEDLLLNALKDQFITTDQVQDTPATALDCLVEDVSNTSLVIPYNVKNQNNDHPIKSDESTKVFKDVRKALVPAITRQLERRKDNDIVEMKTEIYKHMKILLQLRPVVAEQQVGMFDDDMETTHLKHNRIHSASMAVYTFLDECGFSEKLRKVRSELCLVLCQIESLYFDMKYKVMPFSSNIEGTYFGEPEINMLKENLKVEVTSERCVNSYSDLCMKKDSTTPLGFMKLSVMAIINTNFDVVRDTKGNRFLSNIPKSPNTADEQNFNISYMDAFACSELPAEVMPWFDRKRASCWPSQETCNLFKTQGCFVIPVGHTEGPERDFGWKIELVLQERHLMMGLTPVQYKCYILLNITKHLICRDLQIHHCKTALFYTIEKNDQEIWTPEKLIYCFKKCLSQLYSWVECRYCPDYFMPDINLFEHIDPVTMLHMKANLLLLDDNFNVLFTKIHQNKFQLQNLSTFNELFLKASIKLSLFNIVQKSLAKYSNNIEQAILNMTLYANLNRYFTMFENNHIKENKICVKITKEAFRLISEHLQSKLACLLVIQYSNSVSFHINGCITTSEYVDSLPKDVMVVTTQFTHGNHDACRKDLKNLIGMLDKSYDFECPFCVSCYKVATGLKKKKLQCLVFDTFEINVIPLPVAWEFYRNNPYWIDSFHMPNKDFGTLVLISPLIYLYFLQYKNSKKLGNRKKMCTALYNLENVIFGGFVQRAHLDTARHLLAHILVTKGWCKLALNCLRLSFQSENPFENAAKWQSMFILFTNMCN